MVTDDHLDEVARAAIPLLETLSNIDYQAQPARTFCFVPSCWEEATLGLWAQVITGTTADTRTFKTCPTHHRALYAAWRAGNLHELEGLELLQVSSARLNLKGLR